MFNNNNKEVSASGVSTFNTEKKTVFFGCFNQGDFEDLDVHYFEGTESSLFLTGSSTDWDATCEKIMIEINSIQDFINYDCITHFSLMCENNLIKIGFYDSAPDLDGEHYEFTITNNENGEIVVSDLEMNEDEDDEEDYYDDDDYDDDDE